MMFGCLDYVEYIAYDITPTNEQKRIRVFENQLQETLLDNTTLNNFTWNVGFYFKTGIHLIERYPNREIELEHILINFWKKMQIKYKELQEK